MEMHTCTARKALVAVVERVYLPVTGQRPTPTIGRPAHFLLLD